MERSVWRQRLHTRKARGRIADLPIEVKRSSHHKVFLKPIRVHGSGIVEYFLRKKLKIKLFAAIVNIFQ